MTLREAAQAVVEWMAVANASWSLGWRHELRIRTDALRDALAQPDESVEVPMNERDRLAADLAETSDAFVRRRTDFAARWNDWASDRLIALGWTRLVEDRLARALDLVDPDSGPIEGRLIYTPTGQDRQASLREWAAAIAKAYREDTDAEH